VRTAAAIVQCLQQCKKKKKKETNKKQKTTKNRINKKEKKKKKKSTLIYIIIIIIPESCCSFGISRPATHVRVQYTRAYVRPGERRGRPGRAYGLAVTTKPVFQ